MYRNPLAVKGSKWHLVSKSGSDEISFGSTHFFDCEIRFRNQSEPFVTYETESKLNRELERDLMEEGEGEERALSVGPQPSAFACRSGGHHDRLVRTAAPAGPQMRTAEAIIPPVRIWGPVPKAQAVGAGALAAASSVLLAPQRAPARNT